MTASAPLWVRAASAITRRLPRGQYWVVSRTERAMPAFVSALAPAAGGARFECDFGDSLAREACLTGMYEPPVTRIIQQRLRPGGTAIDIGANWGYFTLVAASRVGPTGRVLSLEPDPRHFGRLERNVTLNGWTNVRVLRRAAASRPGHAILAGHPDGAGNRGTSRLGAASGADIQFEVMCEPVDELSGGAADLVKIDVEGAEIDVLRGMHQGLSKRGYKAIVLEAHPELLAARGESAEQCFALLQEYGYHGRVIDVSGDAYRRAARNGGLDSLLQPLEHWRDTTWPHLLWTAAP